MTYEVPGRRVLTAESAGHEFYSILKWAMGQAENEDLVALRMRIYGGKAFDAFDPSTGPPPMERKTFQPGPITVAAETTIQENILRDGSFDPVSPEGAVMTNEELLAEEIRLRQEWDFEQRVIGAELNIKVRREAERRLKMLEVREPPEMVDAESFLAETDEPISWRVDPIMTVGSKVLLVAQMKAGKTNAALNLMKCLADGGKYFDAFDVTIPSGRIAYLDFEMPANLFRHWIRRTGIVNTKKVTVNSLNGFGESFNIMDKSTYDKWVEKFKRQETEFLIFDCLAPVVRSIGIDENSGLAEFVYKLDALCVDAGISEKVVIHHMGHSNERLRGDSALGGWCDSYWRLVMDAPKIAGAEPEPDAPRFFGVRGRQTEVPLKMVTYDPHTGWMSIDDDTPREKVFDNRENEILDNAIVVYIGGCNEKVSTSNIRANVKGNNEKIAMRLESLVVRGLLMVEDRGSGKGKYYWVETYGSAT